MKQLLFLIMGLIASCAPAIQFQLQQPAKMTMQDLTEPEWGFLIARARGHIGGEPNLETRLEGLHTAQGAVTVSGGMCYEMGVAWDRGDFMTLSLNYGPNGELSVNEQLISDSVELKQESDTFEFCTDKAGTVKFAAVLGDSKTGTAVLGALHIAVALKSRVETDDERVVRKEREMEAYRAGRAENETNLWGADYDNAGEDFADACRLCRRHYYDCIDNKGEDCKSYLDLCFNPMKASGVSCATP